MNIFFGGDKLLKKYSHVNQITITSFLDRGIGNFMGKFWTAACGGFWGLTNLCQISISWADLLFNSIHSCDIWHPNCWGVSGPIDDRKNEFDHFLGGESNHFPPR